MSGRHSWTELLERTYTSEERAAISADGDRIVADNRRRQAARVEQPSPVSRPHSPRSEQPSTVARTRGGGS